MDFYSCFIPVGKIPRHQFSLAAPAAPFLRSGNARFSGSVILDSATKRFSSSISNPGKVRVTSLDDKTKPSAIITDPQESKIISNELRKEAEDSLEWRSVCSQVAEFCSTSMGRDLCLEGGVPIGKDRDESQELLDQTSSALLLTSSLDFSGVDDISNIVDSAVKGNVLSIGDLCAVDRSLRSARNVYQQLVNLSSDR